MHASILMTLLLPALSIGSAAGRQIEDWPYDRLFKEADLVVIASAQATADSDDPAPDGPWKACLVGQRTTFSVITTLKGRHEDTAMTVQHFRLRDGAVTNDGPLLVAFRTKGLTINGGGSVKYIAALSTPQYLLFLKRSEGGRLEPVSGQIDPKLSVKEIYEPLPVVMDEK